MKQGKGLEQQINSSNKKQYTTLTEKTIRDFMDDLSLGKLVKPRDSKTGRFLSGPMVRKNKNYNSQTQYIAMCGLSFMDMFDKAMKNSIK